MFVAVLPLLTKPLTRTTTLTLPASSAACEGAIQVAGSEARSEGADAEDSKDEVRLR